jgi:hypothetical protein
MIRIGALVWFVVLALLGVGLFQVKYAVQAKEREVKSIHRQIAADREALRVLEAEWSYLNDPERLADLARRHTDLAPIMAGQIMTFATLEERKLEAAPVAPPLLAGNGGVSEDEAAIQAILADMAKAQGHGQGEVQGDTQKQVDTPALLPTAGGIP